MTYLKKIFSLLLMWLCFSFTHGQTYIMFEVSDTDTGLPITNAKIVTSNNKIIYTNDEGKASVPNTVKLLKVSAPTYIEQDVNTSDIVIKLKPIYKDIEKVEIRNIDVRPFFQNVLKDYPKLYYAKPSLYAGTIKQKAYMDKEINNLLVTDVTLWSLANAYNFKAVDDIDSFVQIELNNVKYYKTKKHNADNFLNTDLQISPKNFIPKLFFNGMLAGLLNDTKGEKITSKLIYENSDIEIFAFETKNKIKAKGKFIYNRSDKLITYFDIRIDGYETKSNKYDKDGKEYTLVSNSSYIVYDFYKNNNDYIPSLIKIEVGGSLLYNDKKKPINIIQEFSLTDFRPTNKKGIKNKISLSNNLTDNIPSKDINNTAGILLSKEEKEFIDEP